MTKARNIADIASDGSPLADGVINYGDITGLPTLGTVASTAATDYATAAQGALADTATQPADVATAISNLVDTAPSTLDTLNELAAALGDDPNFATTVTNSIATKLPLAGGTLTGGLNVTSGNVGIGTSSPSFASGAFNGLEISYSTIPTLRLTDTSNTSFDIFKNGLNVVLVNRDAGYLRFDTSNSERMRIDSAGNVGIGTSSPQAKLQVLDQLKVSSADQSSGAVVLGDGSSTSFNVGIARWNGSTNAAGAGGVGYFSQGSVNAGGHYFYTGDAAAGSTTERLRIDSSGNVGIGTSSPAVRTEISGTEAAVSLRVNTANAGISASNYSQIQLSDVGAVRSYWRNMRDGTGATHFAYNDHLAFLSDGGGTERMRINNSGNVGIGTSSPAANSLTLENKYLSFSNSQTKLGDNGIVTGAAADGNTRLEYYNGKYFTIAMSATERMRIDASGNVGIGTSTINSKLVIVETPATIVSGNAINGSTMKGLKILTNANGDESVGVWFGTNGSHWSGISGQRKNAAGTWGTNLSFYTHEDATTDLTYTRERMTIDSSGNVGIGTTSPSSPLDINAADGVADNAFALRVQNLESTDDRSYGVYIQAGSTSVDSALAIYDHTGANSLLWLAGNGNVGIGTSSPGSKLDINRGSAGLIANFTDGVNTNFQIGTSSLLATIGPSAGSTAMAFKTGDTERMRIDSSGNVLVGTTAQPIVGSTGKLGITSGGSGGAGTSVFVTSTSATAHLSKGNSDNSYYFGYFLNWGGSNVGNILCTASATAYNTSSDYRLKTDAQPMTGASDRVLALKPVNFEWISSGERVDGFLAHEAQEIVPECVTGTKDAMRDEEYEVTAAVEATYDEDGNELTAAVPAVMGTRSVPDYQGIDQSKLVPLLTAALQEALTEISALKARVTALEG
jgi:hypothetical protein